ncbi:MAG: NTF2-like N-terminal transpeptidase domain-containing protein, partial [Nocardioidaceae bacterium]
MRIRRADRRAVVLLLAGALFFAACTDSDGASPAPSTGTTEGEGGADVIRDFAAAWPTPTTASYRGIVDEPSVAARDISAHIAELGITETRIDLENDLDCDDDDCRQHAQVTHQLSGVGEWSYQTLVEATLNESQWLVDWSPAIFHPDLTEVTT